jgi:diguanylate cyclase (GGDEF)-like protein
MIKKQPMKEAPAQFSSHPLLEALPAVAYLYDFPSRSFVDINRHGRNLLSVPVDKLVRMREAAWRAILHGDDAAYLPRHFRRVERSADGESIPVSFRILKPDGGYCFLSGRETVFSRGADGKPELVLGIAHDSSDSVHLERELLRSALHDPLTGLPNRSLFQEKLDHALRRRQRFSGYQFAVLLIDIDRFQMINEGLGHQMGDQILIRAARRIEECLVEGDTVARFGGDEFAVLLDGLGQANEAAAAGERILQALSAPFMIDSYSFHISASAGISLSAGVSDSRQMLRQANLGFVAAKRAGGGRVQVFERRMSSRAAAQIHLTSELRFALEREEFTLLYQPICSLDDGSPVSFEALLRWRHPARGLLAPGEFLAAAGTSGLIVPIGYAALEIACARLAAWRGLSPAAAVSVNVDGTQFSQPDLALRIASLIGKYNVDPERLRLEVTETVIMENLETVAAQLAALRNLGVRVLLDDFGIGFSSLSRLRRFPIDTLKIDRSFVENLESDSENGEIIRAILTLAGNLGLTTVAEGVETQAQAHLLLQAGCDYGQGYYFHPALEAEEAERLLVA